MSQHEFRERSRFTLDMNCHWCGHKGLSIWETTGTGHQIVSLEGFYDRVMKKAPFRIETVCDACDRAQPL